MAGKAKKKANKAGYDAQQQTAENAQPSALQFQDKTFKFDNTDISAPNACVRRRNMLYLEYEYLVFCKRESIFPDCTLRDRS